MAVAITCGYGGYLLPLLAAHSSCISVSHKDISVVSAQLENETQIMTKWFADNSMKANVDKFQGIILSGGRNNTAIQVSLDDVDIAFVQKIDVLGVCIDGKLNFNEHVCRICSKASAQISALQRLTGLLGYPSRKAIYTSFIASNFNYCPLVWFFTSRESIDKIDKIQERALRFVLKDHISDYTNLLLKSGFDSFRIYAVKCLMIELFKILKGITPNYLSDLFVKADNPYDTRDKYKLIQPLKRTTTYGLRSFQYYGAHVWNMLSINIKAAHSLHEFKWLSNKTVKSRVVQGVEINQTTSRLDRKQKCLHACAAGPERPCFTKVGWASRWQIRESHFK